MPSSTTDMTARVGAAAARAAASRAAGAGTELSRNALLLPWLRERNARHAACSPPRAPRPPRPARARAVADASRARPRPPPPRARSRWAATARPRPRPRTAARAVSTAAAAAHATQQQQLALSMYQGRRRGSRGRRRGRRRGRAARARRERRPAADRVRSRACRTTRAAYELYRYFSRRRPRRRARRARRRRPRARSARGRGLGERAAARRRAAGGRRLGPAAPPADDAISGADGAAMAAADGAARAAGADGAGGAVDAAASTASKVRHAIEMPAKLRAEAERRGAARREESVRAPMAAFARYDEAAAAAAVHDAADDADTAELELSMSRQILTLLRQLRYYLMARGDEGWTVRRVLVVDDSAVVRKMLRAALEKAAYQVDVAENGRDALAQMQGRFYDIVFMDLQMPVSRPALRDARVLRIEVVQPPPKPTLGPSPLLSRGDGRPHEHAHAAPVGGAHDRARARICALTATDDEGGQTPRPRATGVDYFEPKPPRIRSLSRSRPRCPRAAAPRRRGGGAAAAPAAGGGGAPRAPTAAATRSARACRRARTTTWPSRPPTRPRSATRSTTSSARSAAAAPATARTTRSAAPRAMPAPSMPAAVAAAAAAPRARRAARRPGSRVGLVPERRPRQPQPRQPQPRGSQHGMRARARARATPPPPARGAPNAARTPWPPGARPATSFRHTACACGSALPDVSTARQFVRSAVGQLQRLRQAPRRARQARRRAPPSAHGRARAPAAFA